MKPRSTLHAPLSRVQPDSCLDDWKEPQPWGPDDPLHQASSSKRQPAWEDDHQEFIILDPGHFAPIRILVPVRESARRDVEYLFTQYLKKRMEARRFCLGSSPCLKTRDGYTRLDYLLTKPEVPLACFPASLLLEPYFSEPCATGLGLDAFRLLGFAGTGAFGRVLVARKKDSGKIHALKIVSKEKLQRRGCEVYLQAEKQVMARLDHRFIVVADHQGKLLGVFETNKNVFFVMEYYPGGDLYELMLRDGTFSEDRLRFYVAEVVLALDYLHEVGVIYRDLKVRSPQ